MHSDTLALYATPDGLIEIGPSAPAADLDKAEAFARQHIRNGDRVGFDMMVAIADSRAAQEKPLMFKSVRAA